jgi:mediator of DNA damage checkpoint protein 1
MHYLARPRYFSPSSSAIFSTLVISTDHLPPGDIDTVIAGTHARGGMYRDGLTRDVTHLLVLSPTGGYLPAYLLAVR